jgi:hypothetical protein
MNYLDARKMSECDVQNVSDILDLIADTFNSIKTTSIYMEGELDDREDIELKSMDGIVYVDHARALLGLNEPNL